jgi:hypothetical protein
VSHEQTRKASCEVSRIPLTGQLAKHRPYHVASIVAQDVQPVGEQSASGARVYIGALIQDLRSRSDVGDARKTPLAGSGPASDAGRMGATHSDDNTLMA